MEKAEVTSKRKGTWDYIAELIAEKKNRLEGLAKEIEELEKSKIDVCLLEWLKNALPKDNETLDSKFVGSIIQNISHSYQTSQSFGPVKDKTDLTLQMSIPNLVDLKCDQSTERFIMDQDISLVVVFDLTLTIYESTSSTFILEYYNTKDIPNLFKSSEYEETLSNLIKLYETKSRTLDQSQFEKIAAGLLAFHFILNVVLPVSFVEQLEINK